VPDIDPTPWTDWLLLVIAVFSIVASITAFTAWVARNRRIHSAAEKKELRDFINEVTKPIQPGTNGGLSMTDLHVKIDKLQEGITTLFSSHERIKAEMSEVLSDVEGIRAEQQRISDKVGKGK
jgi:predicted  nucleic acid-binding Zn-ribbon protein